VKARGFTLLEVLAAIALLAIAFAIGLTALGRAADNARRGAALDAAVEHVQTLFAEQGLAAPLRDGTSSGTFGDGMRWTLAVQALPVARRGSAPAVSLLRGNGPMMAQAAGVQVFRLDATVRYGAGRVLRLATERAQALPGGQP